MTYMDYSKIRCTTPQKFSGLTTVATLCLVNIRCIFSVNEWTYGTVTTPLDFSCALSFLDLSFLNILLPVHFLFHPLYRPILVTSCMEGCSYLLFLLFTVFLFRDNAVTPFQQRPYDSKFGLKWMMRLKRQVLVCVCGFPVNQ